MANKDKPLWTVVFQNMMAGAIIEHQVRASNADNAAGEAWEQLGKRMAHVTDIRTTYNVLRITKNG